MLTPIVDTKPAPALDPAPSFPRLELTNLFNIAEWQHEVPWQPFQDGLEIGTSNTPEDNFYLQSNTDGPRALRIYNKDVGSGTPVCWKVLMTCEIAAVPLVPDVTLMSLETETVLVAEKKTMSLKFCGGLVTLI